MNKKEEIIQHIQNLLEERIRAARQAIATAKESRDNETKSSVGDKYETGRTVMQFELEKNRVQLNKNLLLQKEISKIDIHRKHTSVEFGSLVITSNGNYFISIGLGKLELNNETYFCISLASPIGKQLFQKTKGDKILLQGNTFEILEVN